MATLPIYNTEGKRVGEIELKSSVFDGGVNQGAVHQAVVAYRANQRKGLAATKTRGEVSGGGVKPWRQKGTGRARVGSIRNPLWRHGGVVFGPHPRDYSYKLPDKIKTLALKSTLNAKVKENNLMVLDDVKIANPKTREFAKLLENLEINSKKRKKYVSTLLLLEKFSDNLKRAARNISFLDLNLARDTHAYEVLSHKRLLITKDGLNQLVKRLSK